MDLLKPRPTQHLFSSPGQRPNSTQISAKHMAHTEPYPGSGGRGLGSLDHRVLDNTNKNQRQGHGGA